ncbi:MAG: M48 family metallopeptidase [Clostridia bacterium]|nr:M48 family metallopeptidase [Clostridia bacterium]
MDLRIIVLAALTAVFLYDLFLNFIRMRSADNPIPANVSDVYDRDTYQKWRKYHAEKSRFSILTSTASFVIDFVLLAFNVYAAFARLFPANDLFLQMFAVFLLSALSSLLMTPFSWHESMVIEEKYGFNKMTLRTFCLDLVKEFVISLIIMLTVGGILMAVHQALGDRMILVFAAVMTVLALGIVFLYPVFGKIFNKFTPLEEGELKERITALLEKNGYKVRAIKVMDASRRTTKSNAYFTGFGKMKTIVLYDTLVGSMTPDEICAVFAHEMGHGLHRDTLKNQALTFLQMIIIGVLAWLTLRTKNLFTDFGFAGINYGFAVILIMTVEFTLLSPLFGMLANFFSRRAEYRADAQAVKEGYGRELISALKKLSNSNLADLAPSPVLVRLTYSHPTLSQRLEAIEKLTTV